MVITLNIRLSRVLLYYSLNLQPANLQPANLPNNPQHVIHPPRKPVAVLNGSSIKKKSDLVYVWFGVTDPPVLFGGSQNTDK